MSVYVNIKKDFGRFVLDVNFEAENEILAFLGASGSGKSMTLKCIAGIVSPDEGKIIVDGIPYFDSEKGIDLSPQKRRVGLLFQNYALFPNMTVAQNVSCVMRGMNLSKSEKQQKCAELLEKMGLTGLEKHYPSQLSGGQHQRVAIARILAIEPRILMLDEPFSALDSFLRWRLERELRAVLSHFSGTTIYVSHNRDEVYRLCDRIAVIDDGKIDVMDEKWNLFDNPRTFAATQLTGCKNISRAEKIDARRVRALDWGIVIVSEQEVDDAVGFVAVRAHHFRLSTREDDPNRFAYTVREDTEDTFSFIYMIAAARDAGLMRWETAKTEGKIPPDGYATVAPRDVLLLS